VVAPRRKIQRFLSQAMFVAEKFTRPVRTLRADQGTVRGFGEILAGKHDDLPEQPFYMAGGGIDEAGRGPQKSCRG